MDVVGIKLFVGFFKVSKIKFWRGENVMYRQSDRDRDQSKQYSD